MSLTPTAIAMLLFGLMCASAAVCVARDLRRWRAAQVRKQAGRQVLNGRNL